MPDARLEVTIGEIKFLGEGSENWLSAEFEKFLSQLPKISERTFERPAKDDGSVTEANLTAKSKSSVTLPTFLQDTGATTNQIRKFVATAIWLQDRNNNAEIKTSDVAKALRDSRQNRLVNPADALNQNVAKGYCA